VIPIVLFPDRADRNIMQFALPVTVKDGAEATLATSYQQRTAKVKYSWFPTVK
jgi:hypothetical protein